MGVTQRTGPIYWVSDIHLSDVSQPQNDLFFHFLTHQACQARALYLMGDVFACWLGDDVPLKVADTLSACLRALHEQGVSLFWLPGNRDFLVGSRFLEQAALTVLPEGHVIDTPLGRIRLEHGDAVCVRDRKYQRYRTWVRRSWVQRLFLSLPVVVRGWVASCLMRPHAPDHQAASFSDHPEPLHPQEQRHLSEQLLAEGAVGVLYGHIHQPLHDHWVHEGHVLHRWVLGEWVHTGSVWCLDEQGLCHAVYAWDTGQQAHLHPQRMQPHTL